MSVNSERGGPGLNIRDRSERDGLDDVERAHLVDPADTSFQIGRWGPTPDLAEVIRRFWVPVWSVPAGAGSAASGPNVAGAGSAASGPNVAGGQAPQRVLQYPVCLMVVSNEYARFYGVATGLSETTLSGQGWAVGVMLTPAAGGLLLDGPVDEWTDRHAELSEVFGERGAELADRVRTTMATDPTEESTQRAATGVVEDWLRPILPLDDAGRLINEIVDYVENDSSVVAIGQICARFHLTERSLQRLTRRRLGLTPKWLIQRRRLHEAAGRLRAADGTLAALAAEFGYADEAHLVRDFRTVTGLTPREFTARFT
ncbi:helix-turn-helix domain-containing protein [Gordonia sp. NPDC003422]